jgi:hypothetical protein
MNGREWDTPAIEARRVKLAAGARPSTVEDYETLALDALSEGRDLTDPHASAYHVGAARVYAMLAQACVLDELRSELSRERQ